MIIQIIEKIEVRTKLFPQNLYGYAVNFSYCTFLQLRHLTSKTSNLGVLGCQFPGIITAALETKRLKIAAVHKNIVRLDFSNLNLIFEDYNYW